MSDETFAPPPPPPPGGANPPPPPPPSGGGNPQASDKTLMLVLAYFGLLALIPFLVEKDDAEVRWHAKHGLVLFCTEIIVWVAFTIVNMILGIILGMIPGVNVVTGILGCLISVALFIGMIVLHVMAIMSALKGERLLVPHVSVYADRF